MTVKFEDLGISACKILPNGTKVEHDSCHSSFLIRVFKAATNLDSVSNFLLDVVADETAALSAFSLSAFTASNPATFSSKDLMD